MKKVFMTKFNPGKDSNCMQASMASIFELELDEVPNFIELPEDDWYKAYREFIISQGYKLTHRIDNSFAPGIGGGKYMCFEDITNGTHKGVNGYFMASVYSPGLMDPHKFVFEPNYRPYTHAVIVDKELNIVHDPHPKYQNLESYPMAGKIFHNGILDIEVFTHLNDVPELSK